MLFLRFSGYLLLCVCVYFSALFLLKETENRSWQDVRDIYIDLSAAVRRFKRRKKNREIGRRSFKLSIKWVLEFIILCRFHEGKGKRKTCKGFCFQFHRICLLNIFFPFRHIYILVRRCYSFLIYTLFRSRIKYIVEISRLVNSTTNIFQILLNIFPRPSSLFFHLIFNTKRIIITTKILIIKIYANLLIINFLSNVKFIITKFLITKF